MSEESLDPMQRPEKGGCVVGISLVLFLIALILVVIGDPLGMAKTSGVLLDPADELRAEFEFGELPFELEFDSAAQLPGGTRVVRLAHPDWVPNVGSGSDESELQAGEEDSDDTLGSEGGESAGDAESDENSDEERGDEDESGDEPKSFKPWTPPEVELVDGEAPMEVFFIFPNQPDGAVRSFKGKPPEVEGDRGGGSRGGRGMGMMSKAGPGKQIPIDGGDLDWGESRVGFRHERTFDKVSATDEIRVNLSESQRYCVLVVRWSRNHSGSIERVEELLDAFVRVEL